MGCSDDTCGTGGSNNPLPGDPDNNSVLTATPAFGGIDVTWTYPTTNSYAVAYVTLYRGILPTFDSAIIIAQVGGNFFYDKQDNSNQYYYWITITSVNGTVGELIGPASATAKPTIEQVIEQLTGKIDSGVLAQSLKTEIDKITLNYAELTGEIASRLAADSTLSTALSNVQNNVDQALAYVNTEITTRKENDSLLASQINVVAVANKDNLAAIVEEKTARIDGDVALTTKLDTITALNNANAAAILSEQQARVDKDTTLASQIVSVNAATASTATALVQAETTARTAADAALSKQITTAQSSLGSDLASVQTTLQTNINTVSNKVTSIGALYSAKVSVNGLVGGFGIYNDGTTIEAGFDVNTFWVGTTNANKRKPFIISGNTTYIDEAAINSLTFTKLRDEAGSFVFENGKLKANYINVTTLTGGSFTSYAWPAAGLTGFYLGPGGLLLGNANSGKYFQVTTNGDLYTPGFNIVNGVTSMNAANIISTFNIKNNAVTVPLVINSPGSFQGNGAAQTVAQGSIYLEQAGVVFAASTGLIGYGSGWRSVNTALYINNTSVSYGGGEEAWMNAAHSGGVYCSAGTVTVKLVFQGEAGSQIINPSIFVQGAYK